eukprot:8691792-Pyramimonas_sp.AAC.1
MREAVVPLAVDEEAEDNVILAIRRDQLQGQHGEGPARAVERHRACERQADFVQAHAGVVADAELRLDVVHPRLIGERGLAPVHAQVLERIPGVAVESVLE